MAPLKAFRLALWAMVALAALTGAWLVMAPRAGSPADTLGRGDYALVTTEGEPFTEASLVGAPSAVFFGFTHCPDVCPTTLGDMATWREELGPEGEALRVFFVTVDPERDTAETLRDYVSWVGNVSGVTGPPEEVEKAVRAFRVYAARVDLGEGEYTMDHSSMVLLFDDRGRLFEPIGYGEDPERAVAKIRRLLDA